MRRGARHARARGIDDPAAARRVRPPAVRVIDFRVRTRCTWLAHSAPRESVQPCAKQPGIAFATRKSATTTISMAIPAVAASRILIVDDDETVLHTFAKALSL